MRPEWQRALPWIAAVVIVTALAGVVAQNFRPAPAAPKPVVRLTVTLPSEQRLVENSLAGFANMNIVALSHDGKYVAYRNNQPESGMDS